MIDAEKYTIKDQIVFEDDQVNIHLKKPASKLPKRFRIVKKDKGLRKLLLARIECPNSSDRL